VQNSSLYVFWGQKTPYSPNDTFAKTLTFSFFERMKLVTVPGEVVEPPDDVNIIIVNRFLSQSVVLQIQH